MSRHYKPNSFSWQLIPVEEDVSGGSPKHDAGKLDWTLLPWRGLESVVRVMEHGERVYSREGWRTVGNAKHRYLKALARHTIKAIINPTALDDGAGGCGEPHLACVVANALFLLELHWP